MHGLRELVSAIVTVTQQFWQYSWNALRRAKYVFPVPAGAAICGFEMRAEDGTVITAVAKENEEAAKEHLAALRQGQMTGLVEYVSDDSKSVFCSVVRCWIDLSLSKSSRFLSGCFLPGQSRLRLL